jgi:hypothetical protein
VTMHFADLILISIFVAAGCAVSYLLLLRKIRQVVTERDLKIAEQLGTLDDAIRALETRLAEQHAASELMEAAQLIVDSSPKDEKREEKEAEAIAPDIQAVIAAAAVATLGQDVHVRSIKSGTSSWSQQGRVLVQGSHNARARR